MRSKRKQVQRVSAELNLRPWEDVPASKLRGMEKKEALTKKQLVADEALPPDVKDEDGSDLNAREDIDDEPDASDEVDTVEPKPTSKSKSSSKKSKSSSKKSKKPKAKSAATSKSKVNE